jgi:hypothetical protein
MNNSTHVLALALGVIATLSCGDNFTEPPPTEHPDHGCYAEMDAIFSQYAEIAGYHEDSRGCPGEVPINTMVEAGGLVRDVTAVYSTNTKSILSAWHAVFDTDYTTPPPAPSWPCASLLSDITLIYMSWDDQFGPNYWMGEVYVDYERLEAPDVSCWRADIDTSPIQYGFAKVFITYQSGGSYRVPPTSTGSKPGVSASSQR